MIEVQLPDGNIAQFPDGTSREIMQNAIRKRFPVRMGTGEDIARSGATGLRQGVESIGGMFGDVGDLGKTVGTWIASKLGATPEQIAKAQQLRGPGIIPALPTTQQIQQNVTDPLVKALGAEDVLAHAPTTTAGEYVRTIGQLAPNAIAPGGVIRRGAMVLAPALLSETAGQITKGSAAEPYARGAGALAGGLATVGRAVPRAVRAAAEGAPTAEALRNETNALYGQLRDAGITYDPRSYVTLVRDMAQDLRTGGFRQALAPQAHALVQDMANDVRAGRIPDFSDLNALSVQIGAAADDAAAAMARGDRLAGPETAALGRLRQRIEDFETNAPMQNTAGMSRDEVNAMRGQARQLALRNIKNRRLERVVRDADTYASGQEAGIRQGIRNLLRNSGNLFQGTERNALLDVANGRKSILALSKLGFDFRRVASSASIGPTVAAGLVGSGLGAPFAAGLVGTGTVARLAGPALTARALQRTAAAIRSGGLHGPQGAQTLRAVQNARGRIAALQSLLAAQAPVENAASRQGEQIR